jgi:hypothetical protein
VKSACSFAVVSAALALPLAACGTTHGSSTDSSTASPSSTGSTAAAGTAAGTVDRSGTAGTTDTTDTSQSTIGSAVTTAMAAATATAAAATTTTATAAATAKSAATTTTSAISGSTATTGSGTTATVAATNKKSISAWVSCTGTTDDTSGAMKAFAAARQGAFTLVVDCPVLLHSGLAIDRGIFIDNGTTVEFTGSGKFFVDNMFHPAFVIANSNNITLTNWNVEWDGIVPVNPNFGGYELGGKFVTSPGTTQPAGAFNDLVLTPWMTANRSVTFDENQGWVKSIWVGGVNPAAVFFITGDSSNVVFTGLNLYVPATAGGNHFMPMAFSFSPNWKSNQAVNGKTPHTVQYAMVPHQLTFSGIDLDGTLMGWQGNVRDVMFENITSHRYGDLQDANGGTTGGIGKWFPPPHLFYLNYVYTGDPGLFNTNIHISNVLDEGPRLGVARDKGGNDSVSGYALSLKLGCTECSVDTYTSNRPDGFMDVLPSDGLTVSNVNATFDSVFINNCFPPGLRFPGPTQYSNVTFENVQMKDTPSTTTRGPLGNAASATNAGIVFTNFQITLNQWAGSDLPLPTIGGSTNNIALEFTMTGQSMKLSYLQKGAVSSTLKGSPVTLLPGASTSLTWTSKEAAGCAASGAWSGAVGTSGTKMVKIGAAGNNTFNLVCQNSSTASNTMLSVLAQ